MYRKVRQLEYLLNAEVPVATAELCLILKWLRLKAEIISITYSILHTQLSTFATSTTQYHLRPIKFYIYLHA